VTEQDSRAGTLFDRRYRILSRLGAGGAGAVYLARHEEMDRRVAVKILLAELFPNPNAFARFRREARAAGALSHPNVVTVHDFGRTDEGEAFLIMEYCEGGSLADRLGATGVLPIAEVVETLARVASAVDAAHAMGIVHRDLKPGNILFSGDLVKVADFGLARMLAPDDPTLTGGNAIGSPFYMSPEQCQGIPAGPASDVYSLGVVAYEALAGSPPFADRTVQGILLAHLTAEPKPLDQLDPACPRPLAAAVSRALAKVPEERYKTAGDFAAALADALAAADADALRSRTLLRVPLPAPAAFSSRSRSRSGSAAPQPIGRERELDRLLERLAAAAAGSGRVVPLAGEPGTGKSTLAAAFLSRVGERSPGALVARGRTPEHFGPAEAHSPFLDALAELLDGPDRARVVAALAAEAPTWAAHFPALASGDLGSDRLEALAAMRSRDRMPREFAALLERLAADHPVVLVLEDLHWADPASVDLVSYLVPRLDGLPLLMVGTYRPADIEVTGHPLRAALGSFAQGNLPWTEIVPPLFARDEADQLVRRELGVEPPRELVDFVLRRTEGNPLFLLNVLNHLLSTGAIAREEGRIVFRRSLDSIEALVPEGIGAVLRQKVERLDESERRLLEAASVEGQTFSGLVVARLVGEDELAVEERLRALARRHRLIEPLDEIDYPSGALAQRFRFVHSLYQHAVYDTLAASRRALWHRRAAEELALLHAGRLDPVRVALAVHCERGRDFLAAIEHRLAAAELAALRNPKDARPHLARALELADRLPNGERVAQRAALLVRLGRHDAETAEFAGDVSLYERAEASISEALRLEPGSVEARTILGLIHLERGENERAFLDFVRALERRPDHAPAWDGLSYLFKNTGLWEASLAAQQRAASIDPRFAHSIRRLSVLIYQERLEEARQEAAALVERRPKFAHYNYWRGITEFYAGDRAGARQWIEQGHALDPEDPIAQGVLAFVCAAGGESERARELLPGAERGAAADGTFTFWVAKVHALLGDRAAAIDWIRRAARLGWWDAPWLRRDPVLAPLAGDPEFELAAADLAARHAAMVRFARSEAPPAVAEALGW
jgi:tetratricopeptide (TPR) repeat protein